MSKKDLSGKFVVAEDETPARWLVLKMLDLQDQLESVNNKIMSGEAVTKDDWRVITKLTGKLDHAFKDEVDFEWDMQTKAAESLRRVMPTDMVGSRSSSAPYSSMDEREKGNKNIDPESQSSVAKINVAALPWSIPNGQENVNAVEDVAKRNLQHQVSSGLSNFVDEPNGEEFFL